MKIETRSAALGALFASTLAVLVSAQTQETPKEPTQPHPMIEALKALTAAQERQAVAWEALAEKGWPTPQNLTLAGDVPSFLSVNLNGNIGVSQRGGAWNLYDIRR